MTSRNAQAQQLSTYRNIFVGACNACCNFRGKRLYQLFNLLSELMTRLEPFLAIFEVFFVAVNNPRKFLTICIRVWHPLQLVPQLRPFVPANVDWVATMAPTVLASMRRKSSSALILGHLAETSFTLLAECLHALSATAILDHEAIVLLQTSIFVSTKIACSSSFFCTSSPF